VNCNIKHFKHFIGKHVYHFNIIQLCYVTNPFRMIINYFRVAYFNFIPNASKIQSPFYTKIQFVPHRQHGVFRFQRPTVSPPQRNTGACSKNYMRHVNKPCGQICRLLIHYYFPALKKANKIPNISSSLHFQNLYARAGCLTGAE
jgi:hypothetical protein